GIFGFKGEFASPFGLRAPPLCVLTTSSPMRSRRAHAHLHLRATAREAAVEREGSAGMGTVLLLHMTLLVHHSPSIEAVFLNRVSLFQVDAVTQLIGNNQRRVRHAPLPLSL